MKGTKRDEPGDRVTRNNKERGTKCMREREKEREYKSSASRADSERWPGGGGSGFGCLNHDFSGRAVTRRHRRYTDRCSTRPLAPESAVLSVTIRALSDAISLVVAVFFFFLFLFFVFADSYLAQRHFLCSLCTLFIVREKRGGGRKRGGGEERESYQRILLFLSFRKENHRITKPSRTK